jgi:hypothetical protein
LQKNNRPGDYDHDIHKQQARGTEFPIPMTRVMGQNLMDYCRRINTQQQDTHQFKPLHVHKTLSHVERDPGNARATSGSSKALVIASSSNGAI